MWFGVIARMSGTAKFVVPLPPYVVPITVNRAAYCWLIGRSSPFAGTLPSPRRSPLFRWHEAASGARRRAAGPKSRPFQRRS